MAAGQLLSAVVATTLALAIPAPSMSASCTKLQIQTGTCGVTSVMPSDGAAVDLIGESSQGGGTFEGSSSPEERSDGRSGEVLETDTPDLGWDWSRCSVQFHGECTPPAVDEEVAETPEPDAPVVVTLRDIASFRPAPPGNGMEPGGWAVEGLPANFVAEASVQVVSGTLLGQPADVRFTPIGHRWTHSDGGAVESAGPGASWDALGQREFTETLTSHTYAVAGEYTVELSVVLRAEYRFAGSGWRSIPGTLPIAGDPRRVLVGEFDTVLTNGDCRTNPSGPGC